MCTKSYPINLLVAIPNLYGGTGTFCKNLISGLKNTYPNKYYVILICFNDRGIVKDDYSLFDQVRTIGLTAHKDIRSSVEIFIFYYAIRRYINQFSPDIIFSIGTYMNILTSFCTSFKSRVILSEHDVPSIRLRHSQFRCIISFLMKKMYDNSRVIGTSKGVIDDLKTHFNIKNAKLIYHGVDIDLLIRLSNQNIQHDLINNSYILSIGRLNVQKDYPTLIQAFSLAVKSGVNVDLVIIGEGEEKSNIAKLILKYRLANRVHLLGYKDNPYAYLKKAKLFILSSIWEGFGYVLLEALALGIPVISTDCPSGPSEILDNGNYGLLVKPKDADSLKCAIISLLSDRRRLEEMRIKAKERASAFQLNNMVLNYDSLFEEVINDKL